MNADLFRLLFGAATLAATLMAAPTVVRHGDQAPFRMIVAGFLAMLFFATLAQPLPAASAVGVLLALVGMLTARPVETTAELADSTLTRKRR